MQYCVSNSARREGGCLTHGIAPKYHGEDNEASSRTPASSTAAGGGADQAPSAATAVPLAGSAGAADLGFFFCQV